MPKFMQFWIPMSLLPPGCFQLKEIILVVCFSFSASRRLNTKFRWFILRTLFIPTYHVDKFPSEWFTWNWIQRRIRCRKVKLNRADMNLVEPKWKRKKSISKCILIYHSDFHFYRPPHLPSIGGGYIDSKSIKIKSLTSFIIQNHNKFKNK